jgi:RNA polymerase sigma-70 factor (ECF subfamily)
MKDVKNAFITAYDSHSDSMFRYCYMRVSNREEALDLVQESFMRTWDYLQKGREIKNLKAFLFMTLNNQIIDWYRKKKSVQLEDEIAEAIPDEYHSKDPAIEIDGKWALSLLDKLDDKTKNVITLRYVEEWSPKEIAKLLGETENSVSVRIHRGIDSLQKFVKTQNNV